MYFIFQHVSNKSLTTLKIQCHLKITAVILLHAFAAKAVEAKGTTSNIRPLKCNVRTWNKKVAHSCDLKANDECKWQKLFLQWLNPWSITSTPFKSTFRYKRHQEKKQLRTRHFLRLPFQQPKNHVTLSHENNQVKINFDLST